MILNKYFKKIPSKALLVANPSSQGTSCWFLTPKKPTPDMMMMMMQPIPEKKGSVFNHSSVSHSIAVIRDSKFTKKFAKQCQQHVHA
jgi:hypothetical protein